MNFLLCVFSHNDCRMKIIDKSSKLRDLRESMVGIEKIKDDPFSAERSQLDEYERVMRVIRLAVANYTLQSFELNQVHKDMTNSVKKLYEDSRDEQEKNNIGAFMDNINGASADFEKSKETLTRMVTRLEDLLFLHNGLVDKLKERDKAHALKMHYEEKLESLKFSKNTDKVDRNKQKYHEAVSVFEKIDEQTLKDCREALNNKYRELDHILGLYMKFFIDYHGVFGSRFTKMSDVADKLVLNQQTESIAKTS
jgi:hypothetical protein